MKTCLVLGFGACVRDDILRFILCNPKVGFGIVACNEAGTITKRLDAWVTAHPNYWTAKGWLKKRRANGFPPARAMYANDIAGKRAKTRRAPQGAINTDAMFPGQTRGVSSGIFAAKVALIDLGYDRAVLCGMPMTATPHLGGTTNWGAADHYARRLQFIPKEYRDRLRSMSGATMDVFGAP